MTDMNDIQGVTLLPIVNVYKDGQVLVDFTSSLHSYQDKDGEDISEFSVDFPHWADDIARKIELIVEEAQRNGEFK